ncbi:MAG: hypothetical protein IJ429_06130 [Lachnospiraceae bacterium]|nr:hypothetical protein [Lachnospiraceae bacterium]
MKGYAKIRLAVFLCIMMVFPSIVSVLPMTAQEVSAASNVSVYWTYQFTLTAMETIQIEKGEKFNIGDYAYYYDGTVSKTVSQVSKASYSSSKKSVLSVDSKGNVKAKKTGKATITIKCKGIKIKKTFQVVKAGTFKDTKVVTNVRKKAEKLKKNMPSKITVSNGYKYLKMENEFSDYVAKNSTKINQAGFLCEKQSFGNYTSYPITNKLAVPQAGRFLALNQLLYSYADKNSPTSTRSSKQLKISSVSATTKSITIKTKQKITDAHILAENINSSFLNTTPSKKSAKAYVYIYDKKADQWYTGTATLKKGSKTITVKNFVHSYYDSDAKKYVSKTVKLKKNHTYTIGAKGVHWGNGKKVTVK